MYSQTLFRIVLLTLCGSNLLRMSEGATLSSKKLIKEDEAYDVIQKGAKKEPLKQKRDIFQALFDSLFYDEWDDDEDEDEDGQDDEKYLICRNCTVLVQSASNSNTLAAAEAQSGNQPSIPSNLPSNNSLNTQPIPVTGAPVESSTATLPNNSSNPLSDPPPTDNMEQNIP